MQELEKILEEIIKKSFCVEIREYESETVVLLDDVEEILEKHMNDGWIPVQELLPVEKINPVTKDYYEYQVTAKFGNVKDVRHYKYGNSHWWNGPGIVDQYVLAWKETPEPYDPKRKIEE